MQYVKRVHLLEWGNMYSTVIEHVRQKISGAVLETEPYTYFEIDQFWPDDFYREMLEKKIPTECLFSLKDFGRVGDKYSDGRLVLKLTSSNTSILGKDIRNFWESIGALLRDEIGPMIVEKLGVTYKIEDQEILYTRDRQNYWLGPHTDRLDKVLTALFYLPATAEHPQVGTAIFTPKIQGFHGKPGTHYFFKDFDTHKVIPYVPNKMFCFLKSTTSFHGVLPVEVVIDRDLLIFDMVKKIW